ncbi:MAG: MaoC/PaaZ C-terminal domain-containing protein [bacterium]|nr:acyl dehydratase [bacterium]MBU1918286.1 acyl dehydratase [bacterium]
MNAYTFEELTIGMTAQFDTVVTDSDVSSFVDLSGDSSPIHMVTKFAEDRGFRDRIVHGVLVASYVSRLIGVYLPGANGLLQTIEMQFRKPCYSGMRIRVSGEIVRRIESVRAVRINIKVTDLDSEAILSNGTVQSGILDLTTGAKI